MIGDICTTGHVEIISGIVIGDIIAASLKTKDAKIQGNIDSKILLKYKTIVKLLVV